MTEGNEALNQQLLVAFKINTNFLVHKHVDILKRLSLGVGPKSV